MTMASSAERYEQGCDEPQTNPPSTLGLPRPQTPNDVFAIWEGRTIDFRTLETSVYQLANGLSKMGVGPGQRVAVMLNNHADHVFTFFALSALGAVWVPVNVNLRGGSLEWIFSKASPRAIIAEEEYWEMLEPLSSALSLDAVVLRAAAGLSKSAGAIDYAVVAGGDSRPPAVPRRFMTRGPSCLPRAQPACPRGLMTEQMLRACATGAGIAADVQPGDVFLLWEPIYHSAGAEMCVLALQESITLAIVPRFSASRFWDQVHRYRVTKLHYLGGVLEILLKQAPRSDDRSHSITLAFGAGCPPFGKRSSSASNQGPRSIRTHGGIRIHDPECIR
jgi:crotonobetaine/carnitine-CoA ligase